MVQTLWDERLVHYQYIEELFHGRRVLEIGCGAGAGARYVAQRARQVVAVDTSSSRGMDRRAGDRSFPNLTYVTAEPSHLQLGEHSFDLVLVPQLERWRRWTARGSLLPEVRRLLADDGAAFFSVTNGDLERGEGMGYVELLDALSQTFDHVRLMGQVPFFGFTIADFSPEGELEPLLDSSLIPEDEPPVRYLALCSSKPVGSPGYSVLQVPPPSDLSEELRQARDSLESTRRSLEQVRAGPREIQPAHPVTPGSRDAARDDAAGELHPSGWQRLAQVERYLEHEQTRADALAERLEQERQRLDREREQAQEAIRDHLLERGRADAEHVRAEASGQALEECRSGAEQQRKRAETAERRCDSLMNRIEETAAEQSGLHKRIADLQSLHQGDLWRLDELTGRLRQVEEQLGGGAVIPQARSSETEELQGEVESLRQQLEEASTERARLEKELMRSESRVTEHSRKATNAEAKVVQLEVRLKRSESEAATLSKWAEELRDDLKEAQGKSKVIPTTPEPEVAALRNDLIEAQARILPLEQRCDRFMQEAQEAQAALRQKEAELQEALRAADGSLIEEIRELRAELVDQEALRQRVEEAEGEQARAEGHLRDAEQAELELRSARKELAHLRRRMQEMDEASEELERLRLFFHQHRETDRELDQLRAELAELQRACAGLKARADTGRDARSLPVPDHAEEAPPATVEADWMEPEETDDEDDEGELAEVEWEGEELLQVRERQLEALLEGAALHRQEMDEREARLAEITSRMHELKRERDDLRHLLEQCRLNSAGLEESRERMRTESQQLVRELARLQGELKRLQVEGGDLLKPC